MNHRIGDPVTIPGDSTRYRITALAHGKALITPLGTHGTALVVSVTRLAQAAAATT